MDSFSTAVAIIKRLNDAGHTAYFAGGWVRDHIMKNASDDIDIATDASPEKVLSLFPKTIKVGISFGVVIVVMNGHQYEVATFRKDIEYIDGRKPSKISYCSPKEDALRRDFTINGMFYDPLTHEIYDYVEGARDIKEGVIRTIGDPYARFIEDRLRMMRAFRFAARFQFVIDSETQEAIRANADTLFPSVAIERVWQEFTKMAAFPHFDSALIEMHRLELLPVIFPTLAVVHLNDLKQRVLCFSNFPKNCPAIFYLLQLFPAAAVEEMVDLCLTLKTSRQEIKLVETYFLVKNIFNLKSSDSTWVQFLAKPHAQLCLETFLATLSPQNASSFLVLSKEKKEHLRLHIERLINKTPLITGDLLNAEGIVPGIKMGKLLHLAEQLAIEHNIDDATFLMTKLKQSPQWQEN